MEKHRRIRESLSGPFSSDNPFDFDLLFYEAFQEDYKLRIVRARSGIDNSLNGKLRASIPIENSREVSRMYQQVRESDIGVLVRLAGEGQTELLRRLMDTYVVEYSPNRYLFRKNLPPELVRRIFMAAFDVKRTMIVQANLDALYVGSSERPRMDTNDLDVYAQLEKHGLNGMKPGELKRLLREVV